MKKTKLDLWRTLHPTKFAGCGYCEYWDKYNYCLTLGDQRCDVFLKKEEDITTEEWKRTFPQHLDPSYAEKNAD